MTIVSLFDVRGLRTGAWTAAGILTASVCLAAQDPVPAAAATLAPPMLDIARQCDASSRRNVRVMSECVVAESEARAEVLQKWGKLSDASAERCMKLGRKVKRFPYVALAKCVAVEPVDMQAAAKAPPAAGKPAESDASVTDWFLKKAGVKK